jgi:hypothetical protein
MSKQLTSIEEWETTIADAPREAIVWAMAEQIKIMEGLVKVSQKVIDLKIHSEVERLTEVLAHSRKVLALMNERLSQD